MRVATINKAQRGKWSKFRLLGKGDGTGSLLNRWLRMWQLTLPRKGLRAKNDNPLPQSYLICDCGKRHYWNSPECDTCPKEAE